MKTVIQVISFETDEVVKEIDVTNQSETNRDKVEMGLMRNMDLERFYTQIVEVEE